MVLKGVDKLDGWDGLIFMVILRHLMSQNGLEWIGELMVRMGREWGNGMTFDMVMDWIILDHSPIPCPFALVRLWWLIQRYMPQPADFKVFEGQGHGPIMPHQGALIHGGSMPMLIITRHSKNLKRNYPTYSIV